MSHFYGNIQGAKGETTRCGSKNSGMTAHIRGWDVGVYVSIGHINGKDLISVFKTGGSNSSERTLLYAITEDGQL